MPAPARIFLTALALLWLGAEWAVALPPLLREGFWPWHLRALRYLRGDTAFQLVALDYALALTLAFGLSVADARRRSRRWGWWTVGFLLGAAPALLLYWANRPPLLGPKFAAGEDGAGVEL